MGNARAPWVNELVTDVQRNCHISDALHARNYSLCIYLLKMREFYRWEQGIPFRAPLPKEPLGVWLSEREALWEELENSNYSPLQIGAGAHEPYENSAINASLESHGLVYSGGYVGGKPHFFLGELAQVERRHETTIYISGRELARELTAPPAMSLGNTIYLRGESLRRMIWERLEEWGWNDPNRAIAHSAAFYDFQGNFEEALDAMSHDELDTLLQHELGEVEIGYELGTQWEELLALLPRSRAEYYLRAIRDHLVDCRFTLPWLLEEGRESSLHFYMANFSALRRELFPELENAYRRWLEGGKQQAIIEAIQAGSERWQGEVEFALRLFREHGEDIVNVMEAFTAKQAH